MKTFVLMISKTFMATHPRKGEETYFKHRILLPQQSQHTIDSVKEYYDWSPKIHTIRSNYDHWKAIADKVNAGEAILSLRQWTGSPYNRKRDGSKQVEILQLTKMGVQRAKVFTLFEGQDNKIKAVNIDGSTKNIHEVAKNDGLTVDDFCQWFKKDFDGCVIHFSDFKY